MSKDKPSVRVFRPKDRHSLIPCTEADEDAIMALKEGVPVEITIKRRRRTPDQNAGYWAMLQKVLNATEAFPDTDRFHDALKMALNVTEIRKTLDGEVYMIPGSTRNMDVETFSKFWNAVEKLIAEKFGINVAELRLGANAREAA